MATVMVRCPKCGAQNPEDPRRVRRCATCHEPLRKCRYCRSYDSRILDCVNVYRPPDLHISDADDVRECPYFASALSSAAKEPPGRRRAIRFAAAGVALAVLLIWVGVRGARSPDQLSSELPLRVAVTAPDSSTKDEGFDVQVVLFNPTEQPVRGAQVVITGSKLPQLTCRAMDPAESFRGQTSRTVTALAGDLAPAEHRAVSFHFTSSKAGPLTLTAHVTCASSASADAYEVETEVIP